MRSTHIILCKDINEKFFVIYTWKGMKTWPEITCHLGWCWKIYFKYLKGLFGFPCWVQLLVDTYSKEYKHYSVPLEFPWSNSWKMSILDKVFNLKCPWYQIYKITTLCLKLQYLGPVCVAQLARASSLYTKVLDSIPGEGKYKKQPINA